MIGHLLNQTAQIHRPEMTTDAGGGRSVDYVPAGSIGVRVSTPSPAERRTAAQLGVEITAVGYVLPGADVRRNDRLTVGADVFDVVSAVSPSIPIYQRLWLRNEPWRV